MIYSGSFSIWPPGMVREFTPIPEAMPGITGTNVLSINQLGIRGDDLAGDETLRILALGASTTLCGTLDDTETWAYLLQSDLQKAFPAEQVWVGAAGRPGNTLKHNQLQLEHLLTRLPEIPDLLLMMVGGVELSRSLGLNWGAGQDGLVEETLDSAVKRAFAVRPKPIFDFSYSMIIDTVGVWLERVEERRSVTIDTNGSSVLAARDARAHADVLVDELPDLTIALDVYEQKLTDLIEYAHDQGMDIVLVTQPSIYHEHLDPELAYLIWGGRLPMTDDGLVRYYSVPALARGMHRFNERLLKVCGDNALKCIDLDSQLPKDNTVYVDAVHFNESGAREVARLLSGELRESGVLVPGEVASID